MTHRIMAVIIDRSLPDPKPELVECEATNWYEAPDMVVATYNSTRRGGKLRDYDRIELRAMTVMRVGD